MKRCQCLRYLALMSNRKNESTYVFVENDLYPIEAVFPLEDFVPETGSLITICPLYNYLHKGRLIHRAYDRRIDRELTKEDRDIIRDAIAECANAVPIKKHLVFSERHKEILDMFCKEHEIRKTWRLLKAFLQFLKVRKDYKDDSLCKDIPPEEKKKCFDQLWVDSFTEYLKDAKFKIPERLSVP